MPTLCILSPSIFYYPKGWAAPSFVQCTGQHLKASEQAQKGTSPRKIMWQSKTHVRVIPVVTLIRTDTTLDHSQKAEKVCTTSAQIISRHFMHANVLHFEMFIYFLKFNVGALGPAKIEKSHCCVPLTATFSKRRKIGASWSERCDAYISTFKFLAKVVMQTCCIFWIAFLT
jgi:hypothetical protein